jgi:hypothetical protein
MELEFDARANFAVVSVNVAAAMRQDSRTTTALTLLGAIAMSRYTLLKPT